MPRILYVDDNPSNVRLLEAILSFRPDLEMITAEDGRGGLSRARAERPDVVLLDLNLPDMRGGDVLDALQGDPTTAGIPNVVVTAEDDRAVADDMLARGARAYITKPFDMNDLLGLIDRLIQFPESAPEDSPGA